VFFRFPINYCKSVQTVVDCLIPLYFLFAFISGFYLVWFIIHIENSADFPSHLMLFAVLMCTGIKRCSVSHWEFTRKKPLNSQKQARNGLLHLDRLFSVIVIVNAALQMKSNIIFLNCVGRYRPLNDNFNVKFRVVS